MNYEIEAYEGELRALRKFFAEHQPMPTPKAVVPQNPLLGTSEEMLAKTSLKHRHLAAKYPQFNDFYCTYTEGSYLNTAYEEYWAFADGKRILLESISLGSYA